MSRFPDALHWRSACVIDPVLKAWGGSWSVSFAVRCGETATHFAFAGGVITGVDGAAQFTLSAPAPIWEKFLQPIPPRHHHSIFAMHRQVPEFRIEGDELAFAQHCHIARRVLEIGLGTLQRTERLLSLLQTIAPEEGVQYVGLDRFEGRLPGDPPGVTLKQAHQRLRPLARVQLWPGSADTSLSRLCNHLGLFDLVLVSADNEPQHLERSWFFIQRVVNAQTTILVETAAKTRGGATLWQVLEKSQLDALAARTLQRRAA